MLYTNIIQYDAIKTIQQQQYHYELWLCWKIKTDLQIAGQTDTQGVFYHRPVRRRWRICSVAHLVVVVV